MNFGPSTTVTPNTTPLLVTPGTTASSFATYSTDANGNLNGIVGPISQKIGFGPSAKTALRRQEASSYLYNGSLIQAPLWTALTAYNGATPSCMVRLSTGQLLGVSTGGTSGASQPAFSGQALIADGSISWSSLGKLSRLASTREVPTVAVATTPPGGTTAYGMAPAVTGWVCNGYPGLLVGCPNGRGVYSQYGNGQAISSPGFYNNGGSGLLQGITGLAGVSSGGWLEFISDAPAIGFNMTNQGNTSYALWVGDVDGRNMYLVEEGDSIAAGSNPYWRNYTWPEGRMLRRYRMENNGSGGSQLITITQLAVTAQDSIFQAPADGVRGIFISDSYAVTQSPNTNGVGFGQLLGQLALRIAGVRYPSFVGQGGSGYVAGSTVWGTGNTAQIPLLFQNNAFSASAAMPTVVFGTPPSQSNIDVVVFAAGFNDIGQPSSTITANALYSFQQARVLWPNAVIVVFGPAIGNHNASTNQLNCEAAIQSAFNQWADPTSAFYPVTGDPNGAWASGTGNVGAVTGTGNSDFYTGSDATHPPAWGHQYLARRYAMFIDQAMTAFGK